MLSYQHSYHAGGPADVHKHVALCLLLGLISLKAKPFCVIDLYAGDGDYDLAAPTALKTEEFKRGIARLWEATDAPPTVQTYLEILNRMNPGGVLRRYPGSPAVSLAFLRDDDRLILNELHPAAISALRRWARNDARASVHKRDGLEALVALAPPEIRRGIVLIDPSYEVKTEYTAVPEKLALAVSKWREGIFVVWYPVLKEGRHRALLDGLAAQIDAGILVCELTLNAAKLGGETSGLRGTGLAIVNPPWRFETSMAEAGDWLATLLGPGEHAITWLKRGTET